MLRERSEIIKFSRDDLERLVRYMAQSQIIGPLFVGKMGNQTVQWLQDGGIEVVTTYQQGGIEDLPPAHLAPPEQPKIKHKK